MNVQPPIQHKFIALPGSTQRDAAVDNIGRRPSLAVGKKPNAMRGHLVAFIGEFLGTFMFLFFAFAAANVALQGCKDCGLGAMPTIGELLYISLAFGFSLAVNAWVFFRISGGLFNPAVTLGLMLIGCLTYLRAAVVLVAQIVGAIAASAVVKGLFPSRLYTETSLSPETSIVRGLFIEMFMTALLVFTIFMLAAEKHRATFIAPIGIGLALFVAHLAGARFTGAGMNPARSLGPSVVNGHFERYHWIYWIGPLLGALLAVLAYRVIKALEYETYGAADQDADRVAVANNSAAAQLYDTNYATAPTPAGVAQTPMTQTTQAQVVQPQAVQPQVVQTQPTPTTQQAPTTQQTVVVPKQTV